MKNNIDKKLVHIKAIIAILFTISIIIFSEQAFDSAVDGLHTWWDIVFPALLPFFIMAEILMGLGVVHFIGALLEPLMRPLFKVPGVGAFALAMGLASGYPIGAKITGNLRRERLCTQAEGERLVSFTNTADPLFMIGAVALVT
ncbi:sporulation integral membrane protein YlbJ [Orenia marismortui]|uniref:Sporulation integral membrane protein YlbJ n=1 Tax=Orenia marismortui TaxID=46469 RepID=A0A4R8HA08_9FIRM|nr:nucleoside recognition domain-containing protein [Orenia marismortui]TDX52128.1 sporulation integral membrane protein YlbJ [Orenia marismortui]